MQNFVKIRVMATYTVLKFFCRHGVYTLVYTYTQPCGLYSHTDGQTANRSLYRSTARLINTLAGEIFVNIEILPKLSKVQN